MTCETCKDTKQVRRLAPATWRRLNEGVSKKPNFTREPCPDCAPKPFARSFDRNIRIQGGDGYEREIVATAADLAADAVTDLNAAVEAREAKLRGALQDAMAPFCTLHQDQRQIAAGGVPGCRWCAEWLASRERARAALADEGQRYVDEHEHALLMNAFRDLQVVVDALDGGVAELAPFLEAMGLRPRPDITALSDQLLIAEVSRRGYTVFDPDHRFPLAVSPVRHVVRINNIEVPVQVCARCTRNEPLMLAQVDASHSEMVCADCAARQMGPPAPTR